MNRLRCRRIHCHLRMNPWQGKRTVTATFGSNAPPHNPHRPAWQESMLRMRAQTQPLAAQRTHKESSNETSSTAASKTVAVENPAIEPTAKAASTPTADPLEITALELLLADPAIQEVIDHFGGPRELPASGNAAVADSLLERYGASLVIRLNQLQVAQKEVQRQYLEEVNAAGIHRIPGDNENGFASKEVVIQGFDLQAFTRLWAEGDSPLQKAWKTLYGSEAIRDDLLKVRLLQEPAGGKFISKFVSYSNTREYINHRMLEPQLVWFDPQRGWLTDSSNFKKKSNKLKKLLTTALTVVASYFTWGAAAGAGAFAQGAAAAAAGSAAGQLTSTGSIRFKNLFQTALAGGFSAGIMKMTGLNTSANTNSSTNTFSQRLIQHTGKATLQGAIQTALGGKFKDGVTNSLMSGVAGEVGTLLQAQINETPNLNKGQIYQYHYDNAGVVHFAGIITKAETPTAVLRYFEVHP